ncbi:unnamed protein product [Penicillium nalgiovense]|jgi:hypothetical protein|uniref:Regulatory protein n=1 Tax=Penicillium chrysogenum TaxID=5076 RepID=A0A167YIG9_PENCH|nr:hypothetical protein N7534_008248 [Penicillium rubens]KZN94165.1 Regulatory protein [Penicillium chrysogenum]CAG7999441.1 unnamed protein product [Penicillium nalgiovense]CAG8004456.1 unnamed protein product [Penicillium nalgiovense]CAG8008820.1 unnamed protein product [Penicillium nalgiovense]
MSANMLFTGGSPQMEQQITPPSSQIYGGNDLAFSNGIQTLFHDSAKLKANIAPSPAEWPGMEFHQNHGGLVIYQASPHSVQKHEGGCDSHYHGQPGCSIDPGSIYCGSRPVICWLEYLPTSVPSNHLLLGPPPENFDYVPSFFGTCLFPNQANINSPYPRPLEALQHDSQNDVAEPRQAFGQPVNLLYTSQDPSNLSLGGSQTNVTRRQFKCGIQGCRSHFKLRKTLNRHLESHSGERPHFCWVPGCQRSFLRRDNLKAHYATHGKRKGRNRYVATLDKTASVYNPEFCGQLTPEGWPLDYSGQN